MERITLAIADHDSSGIAACRTMLSLDHDITVITQIAGGKDLVSRTLSLKPRVLLLSVGLCTDAECSVLEALRHKCPETLVVLLADHSVQEDQLANALAAGARGYLEQDDIGHLLANVVHRVAGGEAWVPRKMLGKIMAMAFP
jgi:DNA-binding NarL/FixJ family response regulator